MPRPRPPASPGDNTRLVAVVADWFARHARPLPWRTTPRDPYASLVSEFMAQQTQISRVVEKFTPFLARFPDAPALARADEHDVLAMWSGLGYYRRARLLHAAAKDITARFAGRVPADPEDLQSLPGVGRYTAGAVASIAHHRPAPIVDGNVTRVLLRVDGLDLPPADSAQHAWARATALAAAAGPRVAAFNEGLMELGATVCTPRRPACDRCPLAGVCRARAEGSQARIPRPKPSARRTTIHLHCVLVADPQGRVLLERRPLRGLWAGLWQPPTLQAPASTPASTVRDRLGLSACRSLGRAHRLDFQTTHRDIRFTVRRALAPATAHLTADGRRWFSPDRAAELPLSNIHRRIILGA